MIKLIDMTIWYQRRNNKHNFPLPMYYHDIYLPRFSAPLTLSIADCPCWLPS